MPITAFGAGAMTGSQRGSFVQEKENGILAGLHQRTPAAAELECAGDPGFRCVIANDPAVLVVEATTIAHEVPRAEVATIWPVGATRF